MRPNPAAVEWLAGLDCGWVTDPALGLTRRQQLKMLGNGVVPQQAALALRVLVAAARRAGANPPEPDSRGCGAGRALDGGGPPEPDGGQDELRRQL
jgi:hypothetical protein